MTKKKSKNPCSKCLVRHSPPTGNKCSGLKGAIDEVAMDLDGKNDSAGLLKNCKSTSKKIQKQCKQPSQKSQKSAKDCKTLPSKKKQFSEVQTGVTTRHVFLCWGVIFR